MNRHQRVRAALRGEPVDRLPYAFWTHFPSTDLDPEALAQATIEFVRELDLDFVKTMPNGQFCTEDWGAVSDFSDVAKGGVARVVRPAIDAPEDWRRLERLDVTRGAFGRELRHLALVCTALGRERPVLATTFSPLTIAQKLAGAAYREHLQSHPAWVEQGLAAIAATMARFTRAAIDVGCCGVFFASQEASSRCVSEAAYRRFGVPHDREVLAAARGGWFNVVHMHGEEVMFDLLAGYPVTALNWHVGEAAPRLEDVAMVPGRKPVLGGLRRTALTERDLAAARADVAAAVAATGGRGLLLGPGCVIRHPVDREFLGTVAADIRAAQLPAAGGSSPARPRPR